ncbi:hypothetical protein P9B03_08425 [Metasolibacillus meyeri]|uniref:DUF3021 domain-containing protein n=1 Tax=Metasolibacillus meyeri TaxID=1071052 RepID=A0AAW9NUI4_9BACL|nr:hypothetical protein [Metasolibacillus meyeri]MEC1178503.1 hypothetical protein [Metasolibacillus meyeri]
MNKIMISNAISVLLSPFILASILVLFTGLEFEGIPFIAFFVYLIYAIAFIPFLAILYFARKSVLLQFLLCTGTTFVAALCLEWFYFEPNNTMLQFLLLALFAGVVYFIMQQLIEKKILRKLKDMLKAYL